MLANPAFFFFSIEIYLTYDITLVSGMQHSEWLNYFIHNALKLLHYYWLYHVLYIASLWLIYFITVVHTSIFFFFLFVVDLSYIEMKQPWVYMCSPSRSPSHLPLHPLPLGFPSAPGPAIPLLGIHTKETRSERDTCTPMFIAALFIIARTWKQPRFPSADEWIRKLWYIYTMEYYSAIKKNSFESVLMRWM